VLGEVNCPSVAELRSSIKIKPRIKRKGCSEGSSSLWPSKKRKLRKTGDSAAKKPTCSGRFASADKTLKKAQVQGTPAYCSAIRRSETHHRRTGRKESSIAIEIQDENDFSEPSSSQSYSKDWNLLESKSWLNGRLINCGMNLLKISYPKVKGLRGCTLLDTLNFESVEDEFVQILNCDRTQCI